MRAEFLKLRAMPTPFWCGIAVITLFVVGLAVTFVWGAGNDQDSLALIAFPTAICSIVLGVWIFGVEYGQNTLRRTVAADPDRVRLIVAKLAVVLAVVIAVTVLLYLLALPLYGLANNGHSFDFPTDGVLRVGADAIFTNVSYVLVGAALALITSSMAGGMTAALVFIFVIDGMLSLIPKVGDYTFGLAMADVSSAITGTDIGGFGEGAGHSAGIGLLIVVAWVVLLLALGSQRLTSSDIK
ncbi:MAG: ABC transporter permease [Actinomycetota bacterium]|nr:ABC transporter permease [Actinomycetota bacterium]